MKKSNFFLLVILSLFDFDFDSLSPTLLLILYCRLDRELCWKFWRSYDFVAAPLCFRLSFKQTLPFLVRFFNFITVFCLCVQRFLFVVELKLIICYDG